MYRVATVNLTADASDLEPDAGTIDHGEMSAGEVVLLLERFRDLHLVETGESDPCVEIVAPTGKFRIRTSLGRLFLYNARATQEPYAELTPAEIVVQLARSAVSPIPSPPPAEPEVPPSRGKSAAQRAIAAGILAAGLLINAYTVYTVSYTESVNVKPNVTLLTDAKDVAARRIEITGTYATGNRVGDRVIAIRPDGRVEFSEVGRSGGLSELSDTYQLGRRGTRLCLLTGDGSVIDVLNLETLTYFRDTYRRKS